MSVLFSIDSNTSTENRKPRIVQRKVSLLPGSTTLEECPQQNLQTLRGAFKRAVKSTTTETLTQA